MSDFKNSIIYQCFLEEKEEILKYKWIESEKQGGDIGVARAIVDWCRYHRTDWRNRKNPSK